jgi:hypothetical protein
MPLNPGDIKLKGPMMPTYGKIDGQAVPVFRIFFTVRGEGPYDVMVPSVGYVGQDGIDAVRREAEQIVITMEAFT